MALPVPFVLPGTSYPPEHDHAEAGDASPTPIFLPLPETDIGQIYRGDTVHLPIWRALNFFDAEAMGSTIDLTGAFVWFTAKVDLGEADGAPTAIQRSTADGGVVIEEPLSGAYRVSIDPVSTQALDDDTMYVFDVQVRTADLPPTTVTVRRGIMKVVRDVTRATA
jgi:hypothetical protein